VMWRMSAGFGPRQPDNGRRRSWGVYIIR